MRPAKAKFTGGDGIGLGAVKGGLLLPQIGFGLLGAVRPPRRK
jgi:hypothetical protein